LPLQRKPCGRLFEENKRPQTASPTADEPAIPQPQASVEPELQVVPIAEIAISHGRGGGSDFLAFNQLSHTVREALLIRTRHLEQEWFAKIRSGKKSGIARGTQGHGYKVSVESDGRVCVRAVSRGKSLLPPCAGSCCGGCVALIPLNLPERTREILMIYRWGRCRCQPNIELSDLRPLESELS